MVYLHFIPKILFFFYSLLSSYYSLYGMWGQNMPLPQHDISLNKETIVHKKVVFHFSTCPRNATECSLLFRSFVRTQLTIINIYTYTYKCVCIAKFSSNVLFVCMSIETAVKFQSNSIQHLSNACFNMNNNKCEQHQSNHISAYKN